MTDYINRSNVRQTNGSPYAMVALRSADALDTSEMHTLPLIETSTFDHTVDQIDRELEDGDIIRRDGAKTLEFTINFAQDDTETINTVQDLGNNYYLLKERKRVADANGDFEYILVGNAEVSKNFSLEGKSGSFETTWNLTTYSSADAVDVSAFDDAIFKGDLAALGTVTIPADQGYLFFTAAAK